HARVPASRRCAHRRAQRALRRRRPAHRNPDGLNMSKDEPRALPEIDFATFVLSMASSAFLHLGDMPHPDTQKPEPNLSLAKQTIDILGMLQGKTRGNLSRDEEQLLENLLYDLRLRYVEAAKR